MFSESPITAANAFLFSHLASALLIPTGIVEFVPAKK
jgi:hypothetical protein